MWINVDHEERFKILFEELVKWNFSVDDEVEGQMFGNVEFWLN